MEIGVVGHGVVGRAVADGFKQKKHRVYVYDVDKSKSLDKLEELVDHCEVIFICVDTPLDSEGAFNGMKVRIAIEALARHGYAGIIVIKSTVIPGFTDWFRVHHPQLKFACNPEFLRAKTALQDFLDPDRIVIGCKEPAVRDKIGILYSRDWTCPTHYCTPIEAETAKYLSNLALTFKIAYSEEARRIMLSIPPTSLDQAKVMAIVGEDRRIGLSHIQPLGPLPLSSPCLPKDLQALIHHMDLRGYDTWFLRAVQHRAVAKQ